MSSRQSLVCLLALTMGAPGISLQVKDDTSACSCLPWQQTYKAGKVKCGESNEMSGLNNTQEFEAAVNCRSFYENIKEPICMNVEQGMRIENDLGQWCYVSAQCGGANPVNKHVSWKQCESGKDVLSREKSVQELLRMADDNDLLYPALFKGAYLSWDVNVAGWGQAKYYIDKNHGKLSKHSFPPAVRRRMMVKYSKTPVIFPGTNGGVPFGISVGDDMYEIQENSVSNKWQMEHGIDVLPSKMANISLYATSAH